MHDVVASHSAPVVCHLVASRYICSDDRFIPALCQYAAARVRAGGSAPGLEEKLDAHADQWQADADKSGAASLEPWLAQSLGEAGSGSGVVWQV